MAGLHKTTFDVKAGNLGEADLAVAHAEFPV